VKHHRFRPLELVSEDGQARHGGDDIEALAHAPEHRWLRPRDPETACSFSVSADGTKTAMRKPHSQSLRRCSIQVQQLMKHVARVSPELRSESRRMLTQCE